MEKKELRRSLLNMRQSMSPEEWRERSDRLCTHLQSSLLFIQAQTILAYFSFRQEPDLSPLFTQHTKSSGLSSPISDLQRTGSDFYPTSKSWGFSRCVGKSLIWHRWQPGNTLQTGSYGILEPHTDAPILQPVEVNLILVPAVACDLDGYRLGYGGGFYDRLLSSPEWADKPTIGIVFEFALLPKLPIEPWDKPLQAICTETGLMEC